MIESAPATSPNERPLRASALKVALLMSASAAVAFATGLLLFNWVSYQAALNAATPGTIHVSGSAQLYPTAVLGSLSYAVSLWFWLARLPEGCISGRLLGLVCSSYIFFVLQATAWVLITMFMPLEFLRTARPELALESFALDPASATIRLLLAAAPAWLIYRFRGIACFRRNDLLLASAALTVLIAWGGFVFVIMSSGHPFV